jgi:uncharacterized protein (DUF1778 family)
MDAKPKARKGRMKIGKLTVTLRLFKETKDLLEKAAFSTRSSSLSQYAEKAMLAQFKKDGIN